MAYTYGKLKNCNPFSKKVFLEFVHYLFVLLVRIAYIFNRLVKHNDNIFVKVLKMCYIF